MIPNAGQYSPTWYSEENDTSMFRFIRMTEHDLTGFTVEHKCSICGSVQIEGGFSIDLNNSTPYIVCKSCHENDQWVGFCSLCDLETPDCGPNGLIEYPNHWDAPPQMNHYQVICGPCWDSPTDTPDNDPFNYVQEDNMNRTDDTIKRIEDKIDKITDYLQGRKALYEDYHNDDITEEELNSALKRMWIGLQSRINQAD